MSDKTVPELTPDMLAAARRSGVDWLYVFDPDWPDPDGTVPVWAIRGAFPIRADGTVDALGYVSNDYHRPGPSLLGFPAPVNAVEQALGLAATGYGPEEELLSALMSAEELFFPTAASNPTGIPISRDADGRPVVMAFTSRQRFTTGVTSYQRLPLATVLPLLHNNFLCLNPGAMASVTVPGRDLLAVSLKR